MPTARAKPRRRTAPQLPQSDRAENQLEMRISKPPPSAVL